jgi:hypothetical protein
MSNLFWLSDEERIETPDDFTKRITHDLTLSKQILDRDFAISADLYAFPFNDYGQDTVNFSGARSIVANAASQIYAYGFIQMDPDRNDFFNYPDPNTFFIKRLEPPADWSGKTLLSVVESGSPRTLPYSASSFGPEWQGNWGNVEPRGKTLFLSASPTETGAAATLAGTQWWSDYTITATATVSEGEFSILGRSNGTEAIACTVTGKDLVLEEKKNGLISTLGRADYSLPTSAIRITLALKGSAASCTVGGVSVYGTTSIVRSGDAGFQVWNREKNVAHAEISNVHIDAP